jgi:hypothetical protein
MIIMIFRDIFGSGQLAPLGRKRLHPVLIPLAKWMNLRFVWLPGILCFRRKYATL